MLELAFRAISWTWAVEFFAADAERDETPWLVDLLVVARSPAHPRRAQPVTYFSPNTHLSGEALALYAVSTAFPELRGSRARADAGRTILLHEAHNQVRADGGHAELSAHYHRYSTDFYLLALMVARASNDRPPNASRTRRAGRRRYLRTIADDRGRLPLLGDDDGGQLFRFGGGRAGRRVRQPRRRPLPRWTTSLAVTPASDETTWILGTGRPLSSPSRPSPWPSRVLRESGYFVSRMAGGGHLLFDAGAARVPQWRPRARRRAGRVLTAGGEPVLIDPGTATYTMDPGSARPFRSSRMHNTLVLDRRSTRRPRGPFHWRRARTPRFLVARTGGIRLRRRHPRRLRRCSGTCAPCSRCTGSAG